MLGAGATHISLSSTRSGTLDRSEVRGIPTGVERLAASSISVDGYSERSFFGVSTMKPEAKSAAWVVTTSSRMRLSSAPSALSSAPT